MLEERIKTVQSFSHLSFPFWSKPFRGLGSEPAVTGFGFRSRNSSQSSNSRIGVCVGGGGGFAPSVWYRVRASSIKCELPPTFNWPEIRKMAEEVAKDLTAGTVGGAAQLICGHPFDTIKVKLQSQSIPPRYAGATDALRQTIAEDGARGLYKGMGAPLATVAAMNAVLFTARGRMEALVRTDPVLPLTVPQQVLCGAGAGAGVAVSILACPTELVKCRLQAQSVFAVAETAGIGGAAAAVKYNGPMDVAARVLRSEGGVRGLFKGFGPTLCREVPGNAVMFGTYEGLKQLMAGGRDTSGLGRGALLTAGGLAGASCWLFVYPADVVKSVIQVDDYRQPKYSGIIDAFRKILGSEGLKGLYKGFGPAIMRSVPANAACFLAYEITKSSLG